MQADRRRTLTAQDAIVCQPEKVLGAGGYASVLEGVQRGEPVAVKWAAGGDEEQVALVNELVTLRRLRSCPGIVTVSPGAP